MSGSDLFGWIIIVAFAVGILLTILDEMLFWRHR